MHPTQETHLSSVRRSGNRALTYVFVRASLLGTTDRSTSALARRSAAPKNAPLVPVASIKDSYVSTTSRGVPVPGVILFEQRLSLKHHYPMLLPPAFPRILSRSMASSRPP